MTPEDMAMFARFALWLNVALLIGFAFVLVSAVLMVGGLCMAVEWFRGKSNCLIEAKRLQKERGGYIIPRQSHELPKIKHYMWLPAEAVETHPELRSFVPLEVGPKRLPMPTDLLFVGAMKRCDLKVCTRNLPQCPECEWGKATNSTQD